MPTVHTTQVLQKLTGEGICETFSYTKGSIHRLEMAGDSRSLRLWELDWTINCTGGEVNMHHEIKWHSAAWYFSQILGAK